MGRLIKSDFYKILHTKYFYVCAVLAALMSALEVYVYKLDLSEQYGVYADLFNLNSSNAITIGIGGFYLFAIIAVSLFVSGDFSYGTIKNIVSSGVSRINIYFSKVIVSFVISVLYALISCIASFITGSIIWEVGEYTRDVYIDLLQSISFCLLAYLALVSFYIMIGFLIRRSGPTIGVALVLPAITTIIVKSIDDALVTWFKIENFSCADYLARTYVSKVLKFSSLASQEINTGLIVCAAYIVLATIIGITIFKCRDIK